MTQWCGVAYYWLEIKVVVEYHSGEWIKWLLNWQLIEHRGEARWIYSGLRKRIIQWPRQDRTGLTGTPLGVGLAIKLFIHGIAFINIWPNQQARWVLWKYSQDSSDKRYNQWMHECVMNKDDAHTTTIILQDLINKIKSWKTDRVSGATPRKVNK